jgi:hypothetical protein
MDLGLDITRSRGRATKAVVAVQTRELIPADLALLATEKGSKSPSLKELKDSHHSLARVLATGAKPAEASLITGYSGSRISILLADPAFAELLAFYRANADVKLGDFQDRLADIAKMTQAEIRQRLEDNPESFEVDELRKLMMDASDRIGHGPSSKSTQTVNLNVGMAERMARGLSRAKVIDHE